MAKRQRQTGTGVAGLPVIRRQDHLLDPVSEVDPPGPLGVRHRSVDTLAALLTNGTITQDMYAAGRRFEVQFAVAAFDTIRCMSLTGLPAGGSTVEFTDAQVDARRRVGRALDALGGLGSPAGSCVWHVVGLQCSIREWARRQGWSGRPINEKQAQGILIAALGTLAGHYGYRESGGNKR